MLTTEQKQALKTLINSFESNTLAQDILSVMEQSPVSVHYYTMNDVYSTFNDMGQVFKTDLTNDEEIEFMAEISRYYPSEWTDFIDTIQSIAQEMELELVDSEN